MVTITMPNNNRFQLSGNQRVLLKLFKEFKIRHPNAFFLQKSGALGREWDGFIKYISEDGLRFNNGLLPIIHNKLKEMGEKVEIIDNRRELYSHVIPILPKKVGNNELRGYQKESVKSVIYNKIEGVPFYTGVIDAATNAGKTTIMAALYHAFKMQIPAIILLKDGDLFNQMKKELPELIPEEHLGFVRGKEMNFNKFTVAMVQTLSPKVSQYKNQLAKFGMCLVDEADEGDSASYKKIIKNLFNCEIRVGLSGSIYMSELKKDIVKNMNLRSFFGDVLFKISKKEMSELGFSTRAVIKIWPGNTKPGISKDFKGEYDKNISRNKNRAKLCVNVFKYHAKLGRVPALVVFKFHQHGDLLYEVFKKKLGHKYKIALVNHKTKNRKELIEKYKKGEIDILIASFIVKRGQNFPLIKLIINAAGTDSEETISQLWGRGERTHESKKKFYLDDFYDYNGYLEKHSKHRIRYYKKQGFKVSLKL